MALLFTVLSIASSSAAENKTVGNITTTIPKNNNVNSSLVPSRTTGVAPLYIFFDASATTETSVDTRPFHDLEYRWNFGDAKAGNWANGAQAGINSKNIATGPVTSHVFEKPGTYTVALSVNDGTNKVSNSSIKVIVQDPDLVFADTNTICVGATSVPAAGNGAVGDCPVGAKRVQQSSFPAAISSYAKTGKRLLFKRGDIFTASTSAGIGTTGPGTIGAFGSGAPPVVQASSNITMLNLSGRGTPTIKDWRIMDLDFNGQSATGVASNGGMNQITILRLTIRNAGFDMNFSVEVLDYWNNNGSKGHYIWDQLAIVDCTMTNTQHHQGGVYIGARRFTFAGNLMEDTVAGQHVARFTQIVKGVVSNNTLGKQAPNKHVIKMHGPTWCDSTNTTCNYLTDTPPTGIATDGINTFGYTEQVVISDNKIIPGAAPWAVSMGPQNAQNDERLRNIIVERNLFTESSSSFVSLLISGVEITTRNNIFRMAYGNTGIAIGRRGIEPPTNKHDIYNNSFYSSASDIFYGVSLAKDNLNSIVKNNLGYAPNVSTYEMIHDQGATGLISTNNSSNLQLKKTSPLFTVSPPSGPVDFKPVTGSYTIGSGAIAPVWSDFFLAPRTGTRDLGAVIH